MTVLVRGVAHLSYRILKNCFIGNLVHLVRPFKSVHKVAVSFVEGKNLLICILEF